MKIVEENISKQKTREDRWKSENAGACGAGAECEI